MRLPGGRQAQPGVATGQSHLAWRLGYAEVFNGEKVIGPQPCRGWFAAAARGKAKTPRRGEEFSFVRAPPLRWQCVLSQAFVDGLACGHQAFDSVDGFVEHRLLIFVHLNVDDALNTAAADDGRHAHVHAL